MGISKIEAAQRQLDAAIRLFFADDDWIAVHTLAAASGRVLRDLVEHRGSSVWDTINAHMKPDWRRLNETANFLKHAEKDPDALLEEIGPTENDHIIALNILLFSDLERHGTLSMSAYLGWYVGTYPDVFYDQGVPILAAHKRLAISIRHGKSRTEQLTFWRNMLD